jgi:hypothetical protein
MGPTVKLPTSQHRRETTSGEHELARRRQAHLCRPLALRKIYKRASPQRFRPKAKSCARRLLMARKPRAS